MPARPRSAPSAKPAPAAKPAPVAKPVPAAKPLRAKEVTAPAEQQAKAATGGVPAAKPAVAGAKAIADAKEEAFSAPSTGAENPASPTAPSTFSDAPHCELVDYAVIERCLWERNVPMVSRFNELTANRSLETDDDVVKQAVASLDEQFMKMHTDHNHYLDGKRHILYGKSIEFDYFAYVRDSTMPTAREAPQDSSKIDKSPVEDFRARVADHDTARASTDSKDASRCVAIFEMTSGTGRVEYKLAQLELRLAYYQAHCKKRDRDFYERVALCGLVIHPTKVKALATIPSPWKHINEMASRNKFAVLPSRAATVGLPQDPIVTWVQQRGVGDVFSVAPTANDIDHLKKAIAPDMNPRQQASIIIYAPDPKGDVDELSCRRVDNPNTAISLSTAESPYLFEVREQSRDVLVTDGKVTFAAKPEQPQVMYLKAAIKEKKPNALKEVDADQLIVKDPATGNVMGDKDPLHAGVEYLYELPSAK